MKKLKIYILLTATLFATLSCDKDFEELNKNPFESIETDVGPLFNKVVSSMTLGWNEQFYVNNEALYKYTELGALTQTSWPNVNIGTEEIWTNYYTHLAVIRDIDKRFENYKGSQDELVNAKAMLKVLLALKTFKVTDLFGDMPFFNAGRGFESLDYARPEFDGQEEIYMFLMDELKWVEDNINAQPSPVTPDGTPLYNLAAYDNLFNGNMIKWRRLANSMRLRYALRMSDKMPEKSAEIIAEIVNGFLPVLKQTGDDVVMLPETQGWENNGVNWSFREHGKLRMGETIWSMMSNTDAEDGSGIFDPRAYIFFETNNYDAWRAFPQVVTPETPSEGGVPYNLHRDNNYAIKGTTCLFSPFNYYLVREEKTIPEILMTVAEVKFLLAEAYFRGIGVAQDQSMGQGLYAEGVVASLTFWQNIVKATDRWVNHEPFMTEGEFFSVLVNPPVDIFSAPEAEQLKMIYAQRWMDAFRQPAEAFALARRTLATPRTGPVLAQFRFDYPDSESINNAENWSAQVAKMGGSDSQQVKVWWMN
ncbi:MAG: SusD/RagB family nutrient-binding outer membrane lipoprotein [Lentimicrobium sp.]|jgi:hypothetical protein|nr:SusD/RagB family nutrient-binding outer membrane lipoprotein [Lentimicrobium sp.]